MYPELYTFTFGDTSVPVMTFGLCLTISFILFYWMLWRLGRKYQINTAFFSTNLLVFFLATFFVARLAHVLLYLGLPTKSAYSGEFWFSSFFLMSDFYFSLGGAILGFFGTFFFLFRERDHMDRDDALDITVISWLFGATVGYLGAFLGGQTYGIRSESFLSVDYINNPILAEFPRFPLALIYMFGIIFIFSLTYIIKKLRPERGFAAGVGALLWGLMWFLGEWWNDASSDNFAYMFGFITDWKIFNFNQVLSLFLMAWGAWRIAHIVPSPLSEWVIDAGDIVINRSKQFSKYMRALIKKARKSLKNR
ncbi:prolipoprotein diacylglyceryl transferase [Candidatus Gracilibacteria bacterium]|nr:prolipoprotein diacylglyceryl transferase [Candidatus Gracilibacteria bacterium]